MNNIIPMKNIKTNDAITHDSLNVCFIEVLFVFEAGFEFELAVVDFKTGLDFAKLCVINDQ